MSGEGGSVAPNLQRGVVLPGGESWVAGQMMIYQLLSGAVGFQGWHSGWDALVASPVAPKLPWTWVFAATLIDPRLAGRRRHCPPGTPADLAGDWL